MRKLTFSLVFLAALWGLNRLLKLIASRFRRSHEGKRAEFWTKQGIHMFTAVVTIVTTASEAMCSSTSEP